MFYHECKPLPLKASLIDCVNMKLITMSFIRVLLRDRWILHYQEKQFENHLELGVDISRALSRPFHCDWGGVIILRELFKDRSY